MNVLSVVLQCFLIIAFLFSGLGKIGGMAMQVEVFRHLHLPQWFRVVTGIVQLAGVAGLIIGFWNKEILLIAGLWIAGTMFGAVLFHIRAKDQFKAIFAPLLLTFFSLLLALLNVSALL